MRKEQKMKKFHKLTLTTGYYQVKAMSQILGFLASSAWWISKDVLRKDVFIYCVKCVCRPLYIPFISVYGMFNGSSLIPIREILITPVVYLTVRKTRYLPD